MILGLDWDDTITTYSKGISQLCKGNTVIIITLNPCVTVDMAEEVLKCRVAKVIIMPDTMFDTTVEDVGIGAWKASVCKAENVNVMIDDLQSVCDACTAIGIPSIQVHLKD